mgnify:FL=1
MRIFLRAIFWCLFFLIGIESCVQKSISWICAFVAQQSRHVGVLRTDIVSQIEKLTVEAKKKRTLRYLRLFSKKHLLHRRRGRKPLQASLRSKTTYIVLGSLCSFVFLFLPLTFFIFLKELHNPSQLTYRAIPQTSHIYDRHGKLLAEIYANQDREMVSLKEIPPSLKEATIAIEDKNFYHHPGFDIQAIVRALKETISGSSKQGGSTITQQLIKSSLLTPERTITRKVKEIILAFWAEQLYTKDQILEMYFNQVPYGGTAWGAQAAAELYFAKPVTDLSLAESAFLAGLTAAPSIYSPYGPTPDAWKVRQKKVLASMLEEGYISPKEASQATKEALQFQNAYTAIHAPHFITYVKNLLTDKYGIAMVEKGGLSIYTTLDLATQKFAEDAVKDEVEKEAALNLTNGATLVTNPKNGDVLAMVGSHDFDDPTWGNVNLTIARRQPGSSIKVVTYAAALMEGFTAASLLEDTPVTYGEYDTPYSPVNYDGRFHGDIPLRYALANSYNIPAVKTLDAIGIATMVQLAKDMGITTWGKPEDYGLSLTLGAGEVRMIDLATIYGTLANDGKRVNLNPFLKITDAKGTILEEKREPEAEQVLKPGVGFIISDILADNQARSWAFGRYSPLEIPGKTVSVKTGTTDDKRDNWTIGYTPSYLVAVWVGNNNNTPMSPGFTSGITGAAPIWHTIMAKLLTDTKDEPLSKPQNIIERNCRGNKEYFITGTEPAGRCGFRTPSQGGYSRQ